MKISIHIPLLTVALLLGGATTSFAQWEKVLAEGAQKYPGKVTSAFPGKISGNKRFLFPTTTTRQLQRALASSLAPSTAKVPTHAKAIPAVTPAPFMPQFFRTDRIGPYEILAGHTARQQFLTLVETEQDFYQPEIAAAAEVRGMLKYRASFQDPLSDQEALSIIEKLFFIKNDSLRLQSYRNLLANDLSALLLDLEDYFSLDKPFEEAALSYTMRHPHKRNLRTLRLLHNPFIADSFKKPIKHALQKNSLTEQEQQQLLASLKALNEEYRRIVETIKQEHQLLKEEALASNFIQNKLKEYERVIASVKQFVKSTGHLPNWHTRSMSERDLYNQAVEVASSSQTYPFEPFISKSKEMNAFLQKYESKHRSRAETLMAFENFVMKTGRNYPRMIDMVEDIPEEEWQLFADLTYWLTKVPRTFQQIHEIQLRHALPQYDPFYE